MVIMYYVHFAANGTGLFTRNLSGFWLRTWTVVPPARRAGPAASRAARPSPGRRLPLNSPP